MRKLLLVAVLGFCPAAAVAQSPYLEVAPPAAAQFIEPPSILAETGISPQVTEYVLPPNVPCDTQRLKWQEFRDFAFAPILIALIGIYSIALASIITRSRERRDRIASENGDRLGGDVQS